MTDMATRAPMENGTKVKIHFGRDVVVDGVLNDSKTAKALIAKLPFKVRVSRSYNDLCGITKELPYDNTDVHDGWQNGDIDYATDGPWFTILFSGEEASKQFGFQVNIGVVTSPLSALTALKGSYDVTIELADQN